MRDLLAAVAGAKVLGEVEEGGAKYTHYLLPDGRVLEVTLVTRGSLWEWAMTTPRDWAD